MRHSTWPMTDMVLGMWQVLREATAAVARQCGLSQVHHQLHSNHNAQGPHRRQASANRLGSPTRDRCPNLQMHVWLCWQWAHLGVCEHIHSLQGLY